MHLLHLCAGHEYVMSVGRPHLLHSPSLLLTMRVARILATQQTRAGMMKATLRLTLVCVTKNRRVQKRRPTC